MAVDFLFIVRHGETKANEDGIEAGPLDYPLAKKGIKEVSFIAKTLSRFKIDSVFSSPVLRAVQTAKIVARPHGVEVRTLEELTEAKIKPQFVGKKGRHHILTSPEDYLETNDELLERTGRAMEIVKKSSKGNAVVVSHGDVISAMLERVIERRVTTQRYYVMHPEPASLTIVEVKDRPFLRLYNYHRKQFADY